MLFNVGSMNRESVIAFFFYRLPLCIPNSLVMYIIRFAPVFLFCFGLSFLQHLPSFLVCFPSRSPSPLPSMLVLSSPLFSISTLYLFFSSAMFLTSWCLTYFLRLLQYSPPLYHESTHIHTHTEVLKHPLHSPTPGINPHPPIPVKRDSTSGTSTGCSLIGRAPESLHKYKSQQRREFHPEVLCSFFVCFCFYCSFYSLRRQTLLMQGL